MRIIKQANGKLTVKLSPQEWVKIGEQNGWTKTALWEKLKQLGRQDLSFDQSYDSGAQNQAFMALQEFQQHFNAWSSKINQARKGFQFGNVDAILKEIVPYIDKIKSVVEQAIKK